MATENEFFRFALEHNLDEIVRFHHFSRGSLKKFLSANRDSAHVAATMENYDRQLSANVFLMAYSHLEEALYLIWRTFAKEHSRDKGFSIKRYKPILKLLNVALDDPSWLFIQNANDIRDCLLHANGRLSFMKSKGADRIRAIIEEDPRLFFLEHEDRLRIQVDFLAKFVEEVRELFGKVIGPDGSI